MWKRAIVGGATAALRCPSPSFIRGARSSSSSSSSISSAVNSMLLRSLKDHYLEVAKMNMPPKVGPPSPFTIVKGALDSDGPVLKRSYGDNEEITINVMRIIANDEDDGGDAVDQMFIHVDVTKPEENECLMFLCGLYEDAIGIHSVSMRPKLQESGGGYILLPSQYAGPDFAELEERMRDSFHEYIEERGINQSLFKFLQAWQYVKQHRNLMRWFKTLGLFIDGKNTA